MSWDICPYKDNCDLRKQGKKCFLGGRAEGGGCDGWIYAGDEDEDEEDSEEEEEE